MNAVLSLLLVATLAWFGFFTNDGSNTEKETPADDTAYLVMPVQNAGAVSGTITYSGKAPAPKKLAVTKDTHVCGKFEHFDESLVVNANGCIKDAIVSLKGVKGGKGLDALGANFVLDQKGCLYSPHTSIVPINVPVTILNPDGILHNIHTYSKKNPPFNKSQPQFKKTMTATFTAAELVVAKCDVHGWMSSNIFVVDHPYHAVTDANGAFTIKDVPPGTYTVEIWQEKLGTKTAQVTVAAGQTATLNVAYPAAAN
jgi:hypothetical protein